MLTALLILVVVMLAYIAHRLHMLCDAVAEAQWKAGEAPPWVEGLAKAIVREQEAARAARAARRRDRASQKRDRQDAEEVAKHIRWWDPALLEEDLKRTPREILERVNREFRERDQ